MPRQAIGAFDVTSWDELPYHEPTEGPRLSRAKVAKAFRGDIVGQSTAELLMCTADPANPAAGAGYVANELVECELGGRTGSFVLQHGGVMAGPDERRTFGHVVPGSGTGELEGIAGDAVIGVDENGKHTLTLTYEIAAR